MKEKDMKDIVNHLKSQGFFFHTSEIYGGLANAWDYGPLGAVIKENIRQKWIKEYLRKIENSVLIDSNIITSPQVWNASGHIDQFTDFLVDCKDCKRRFRADKLVEEFTKQPAGHLKEKELKLEIDKLFCPNCSKNNFTNIRKFNLMFQTSQGIIENEKDTLYLRPETAQGIFTNFKNVQRTMRLKIPFGIGQIGKAFRNEITPGNFVFRTREFEQMELEYFINPKYDNKTFDRLLDLSYKFIVSLGISEKNLKIRNHNKDELAHYSLQTSDIEYKFPFGWGEIFGISHRGDFDLSNHQNFSKNDLSYLDPETNEKYTPYVIEPSFGLSRLVLTTLVDAYDVEEVEDEDEERIVLRLANDIAPYRFAILPLVKKLSPNCKDVIRTMNEKGVSYAFDEAGSIGKRYRRQDAIGTPYCITFDYDSVLDNKVTIRYRDSMKQNRVLIKDLQKYIGDYDNNWTN